MSHRLALNRDGEWMWDGVEVIHPGTRRFLFEHLIRDEDGDLIVRCGSDQTAVELEDVPFVVRSVNIPGEDSPTEPISVVLQDGTEEPLNLRTLRIGAENALYTRVQATGRGGPFDARFSRAAFHLLSECIAETGDGRFMLRFQGNAYLID